MKKILHFIEDVLAPTERNGGVPWILSKAAFYVFLIAAFSFLLPSIYFHVSYFACLLHPAPFNEGDVVSLMNSSRLAEGLPALEENPALFSAAREKLGHMVENGYFAHFAPDGTSPWSFIRSAGYYYYAAGENLAVDFVSAGSAHKALMNSPTHRSNILNSLYKDVGVAVARASYKDREAIYIVQMFGTVSPHFAGITPASVEPTPAVPEEHETPVDFVDSDETFSPEPAEIPEEEKTEESVEQYAGVEDVSSDTEEASSDEEEHPFYEEPEKEEEKDAEAESVIVSAEIDILQKAFKAVPFQVGSVIESQARSEKFRTAVTLTAVFLIMASFVLVIMRKQRIATKMGIRTLLLLFMFGYLLLQPHYFMPTSKITPTAIQETSLVAN